MYTNEFSQEFEQALGQEQEYGGSQETFEFNPEFMGETNGESYEMSGELNETQELELAHELLEVSNEQELNMFLGKLIKSAGRAIGNFANSSIGRSIGGALKSVAKVAIPLAGKALGTFVGGPVGGMIGGKLGSMASNLFELELEGLSPEDREFETARAYVRFANAAVRRGAALQRQRPGVPAPALARTALSQAARQHAPGLLRNRTQPTRGANGRFISPNGGGRRGPGRPYGVPFAQQGYAGTGGGNLNVNGSFMAPQSQGQQGPDGQQGSGDDDSFDFDPSGFGQDAGSQGQGQDYSPMPTGRATRGTWMRRGRTLVIQL
ncbi:hypothetical protein [Hymenobacter chitinivorans]|uniref:Uncharacterized protein n=1 Tax=Hymenobacter chitinivorans DSM 11115 TaxID=1121954 RepID=A0A2M9BQD4_9BACT|nr:hypothetical protein [Hymenobacter chitinivorans]PJJ60169.1 hypothetical protein CLV45_1594 [Hymenobacter chitinivorans DSM 11115]